MNQKDRVAALFSEAEGFELVGSWEASFRTSIGGTTSPAVQPVEGADDDLPLDVLSSDAAGSMADVRRPSLQRRLVLATAAAVALLGGLTASRLLRTETQRVDVSASAPPHSVVLGDEPGRVALADLGHDPGAPVEPLQSMQGTLGEVETSFEPVSIEERRDGSVPVEIVGPVGVVYTFNSTTLHIRFDLTTVAACVRLAYEAVDKQTSEVVDSWRGSPTCRDQHVIERTSEPGGAYTPRAEYELRFTVTGVPGDGGGAPGTGTFLASFDQRIPGLEAIAED